MAYYGEIFNRDLHLSEGLNLRMVNDVARLDKFKQVFAAGAVSNKVCCDLGAGSGLLTFEMLEAGATHVYAVELNELSLKALRAAVESHPLKNKITIIAKDICDLQHADFTLNVDVFVSETFGGALYNEGFIVYMSVALSLFPQAETIPKKLQSSLAISPVDFSNDAIWPQLGHDAVLAGFKQIYAGHRVQIDLPLRDARAPVFFWKKDHYIDSASFMVTEGYTDVWVGLIHNVIYSETVQSVWSSSAWYFPELRALTWLKFSIEDNINPILELKHV